jgi:hypothetical protein
MTRIRLSLALAAAFLLLLVSLATSAGRGHQVDLLWTRPDAATLPLSSVAMLPAASYDNVNAAERFAETELAKAIHDAGYRWVSALTAREMLRRDGGDSLLKAVRRMILDQGRVDSTGAAGLCARMRVNGLIAVRVERAEQVSIQSDQSGKPTTTVYVQATLVDSLGRLVWRASGDNTVEGPYQQAAPSSGAGSMSTMLGNSATQTQSNAPQWTEVLAPLFARWAPSFPHRATRAPGADAPRDSTAR